MKSLSFDKMASIEGGSCTGYTGTYCPLALLVMGAYLKTNSWFAMLAGMALKNALCTPCPPVG